MIIDLSHPLSSGMPVYPGDPEVSIAPHAVHGCDGFNVHALTFGTHTGTHVDAPFHFIPGRSTIDTYDVLGSCVGPALVLNIQSVGPEREILPGDIGISSSKINRGDRILLATGWGGYFGTADYFERFPSLSPELVSLFIERGISLLGVETPSLHRTRSDELHKMLLDAGIIIVENLTNLKQIAGKSVFFSAAPLKLEGLDGSPVRAYAMI